MEWQHYNRIKASMAYIENLVKELEDYLDGETSIYKSVRNDLSEENLRSVKEELKKIKSLLEKAKEEFNLEHSSFALSHIINVNASFIWETIDDLWPDKLEKSSGKISSKRKKARLESLLKQLYEHVTTLKGLVQK